MKEYIATIIYICIFSIILELILPNSKLKKYIATIISLLVILTIISPAIDVIKNKDVVAVLSNTLENIKVEDKSYTSYDFSDFQDKMVLVRTKENIEEDILKNCNMHFNSINVKDVVIELNNKYNIEGIKIYVEKLEDVYMANDVMIYVTDEYNVRNEYIEVIQIGENNGNN